MPFGVHSLHNAWSEFPNFVQKYLGLFSTYTIEIRFNIIIKVIFGWNWLLIHIRNSSFIKKNYGYALDFKWLGRKKLPPIFWNKSDIFGNSVVSCDRLDFSFATKTTLITKVHTIFTFFFLFRQSGRESYSVACHSLP